MDSRLRQPLSNKTLGTVVYVGAFRFPDGDAGGLRVLGVGKALRDAGYDVIFAGVEKGGRAEDRQASGEYIYNGFTYVSEDHLQPSALYRLRRGVLTHATGQTTVDRLKDLKLAASSAVIAYGVSVPLFWRLRRFCRTRQIALLADCVEWYDARNLPGGKYGPFYWDSELRMRWIHARVGRVIAISSFLESYYRERACRVLRIPPLVDMHERLALPRPEPPNDGAIRLVYAGSPGKKDLLENAVRGLHRVTASGAKIELHVVGLGRDALLASLPTAVRSLVDELGRQLVCHGRVPHGDAVQVVAAADFSIFLRSDERYAHAGFPSKLVESLSVGVPVLTNATSDICEYVRDGSEGFILADGSAQSVEAGLRRVSDITRSKRLAMGEHARKRALECFDYRNYACRLRDFVDEAIKDCQRH